LKSKKKDESELLDAEQLRFQKDSLLEVAEFKAFTHRVVLLQGTVTADTLATAYAKCFASL